MNRNVFISYSHNDAQFANQFAAMLITYDLNVWKDSRDIPIGGNILKSVYDGIKNASHFCCIISSSSIASAWVEEELSYAKIRQLQDRTLAIIPVLIERVALPDYLLPYRAAHLEDRVLTVQNPEFVLVLKAFGTDLVGYQREIITGPARQVLLERCEQLRYELGQFRGFLGGLQTAYGRYQSAMSSKSYDEPIFQTFNDRPEPRTTYEADARIRYALDGMAGVLVGLKHRAQIVLETFDRVERARKEADPSDTVHRLRGLLHVNGLITYVAETAAKAHEDPLENWWIGEKLDQWVDEFPDAESSVQAAVELLAAWARFDDATPQS